MGHVGLVGVDYSNLFVTNFLRSGLHWMAAWLSTGHLEHLNQIVAVPGWIGNFLVIVGSTWETATAGEATVRPGSFRARLYPHSCILRRCRRYLSAALLAAVSRHLSSAPPMVKRGRVRSVLHASPSCTASCRLDSRRVVAELSLLDGILRFCD